MPRSAAPSSFCRLRSFRSRAFPPRSPLSVGPAVAALGFGLLALPVGGESYWAFLGPIAILGVGMVVSVAPLTTTVINAVPTHQTGVASGINNAVASVANLLAIAVLGALALGAYNQALDDHLKGPPVSSAVARAVESAR